MKIQKRHIVLTALILALSAAVFINWRFSDSDSSLVKDVSKELGVATYVNADVATKDEVANVSKNVTSTDEYFAKASLEREEAQDKAIETAQQTLKLTENSEEEKALALEQLQKLEDNFINQSNIESVLKGKGFSQCLCFITDESCTVSVPKNELKDNAPLIIKDVVLSHHKIDFNNITIIEV
ncbi:MAG: SpoIIIAH-like family protein [Ruminococcus sp.]|nr:SpoIIIAH-like family protein [Ruminococcus sp.]